MTAIFQFLSQNPAVVALLAHFASSAFDALVPQPTTDSPWYWPRKVVSVAALNFANAANAKAGRVVADLQKPGNGG